MAPFSLMTAGVSLLAKSFNVFSCTSILARSSRVLPATYFSSVKSLSTSTSNDGRPKAPLNSYMRFVIQQKPSVVRQNPALKITDVAKTIAQQWKTLSPEQKRPFEVAALRDREQFKKDLQLYQARLTPAQIEQQAEERRQRLAKRKSIRKKRELTSLGKPKRPRSAFNIFMSEQFDKARGNDVLAKMASLNADWKKLSASQKQVYIQLAEDDSVRYKNEMRSWENHMVEIGRADLLREKTISARKRAAKKVTAVKKSNASRIRVITKSTAAKKGKAKSKSAASKKATASAKPKTQTAPAKSTPPGWNVWGTK